MDKESKKKKIEEIESSLSSLSIDGKWIKEKFTDSDLSQTSSLKMDLNTNVYSENLKAMNPLDFDSSSTETEFKTEKDVGTVPDSEFYASTETESDTTVMSKNLSVVSEKKDQGTITIVVGSDFSGLSALASITSKDSPEHLKAKEQMPRTSEKTITTKEDFGRPEIKDDLEYSETSIHKLRFASTTFEAVEQLNQAKYPKTNSEDDEAAKLKSSKSVHNPSHLEDSDDDEATNLSLGHVFVYMVIPPDGGFGWIITIMSFFSQIVVDGIVLSVGIMLPHIGKEFDVPGSQVILVGSVQVGCYFLFGAVSSAFINKFGFRPVALIGCIVSIIVLSIATFSVNISMMIIFYSILGGPSLSMIWVSSQLIIGYYFDKYRPIAIGAACSGAGAGIMIFCLMNSTLLPLMGWRNVMRVHVCFLLVVFLMLLTFKEVTPTRIGKVREPLVSEDESESDSYDLTNGSTTYTRYSLKYDDEDIDLGEMFERKIVSSYKKEPSSFTKFLQKCFPPIHRCWERCQIRKTEEAKRYVIKQDAFEQEDLFYMGPKDRNKEEERLTVMLKKGADSRFSQVDVPEWRTISLEVFESHDRRQSVLTKLSTFNLARDLEITKQQLDDERRVEALKKRFDLMNLIHPKIRIAFSLLFDFRLLAIMEFRILILSAFLFPMGFNIPFVYSTVRAQIEPTYAKLISPTIGLSNFLFRILSGFIAYRYREYTTYICGGGMFIGGLFVFISAFYGIDVVWFQFVYAMCYGIAPAFYSSLRSIIYVRSLGLDKLTNAFGLSSLAMGLGVFIGTTAAGILNDLTGSYRASFVFSGICICAAGGLKLILPTLIARAKK